VGGFPSTDLSRSVGRSRDTRTRRFYTGLGLGRVKPYVQLFGLYCVDLRWSVGYRCRCRGGVRVVPWRTPLPALYWAMDKVGGPESRSVTTGKHISSLFTSWKAYLSCLNPSGLPCLVRQTVFSSSGPHVRSGRPTNRSAGLQMGRTHLSGTATSLVGGDLGVPMSHNSTSSSH
jgi:hypothetical protein